MTEKSLGGGLTEITVVVSNTRMMPTHASQDLKYKIERPDLITINGPKVIAAMIVDNRDMNQTTEQKSNPATIEVENIPGMSAITVRWIVSGAGKYSVKVDSRKGGVLVKQK